MGNYYIMKNNDFRPLSGAEYGKVVDKLNRPVLVAIYDPDCFKTAGYHCCSGSMEDLTGCIVLFDNMYLNYFKNNDLYFAGVIMHELGHYISGDMGAMMNGTPEQNDVSIRRERTQKIISGNVDERELRADRFAADNIGIGRMLKTLQIMKNNRINREDDFGKEIAIKEIDARIKALENYRKEKRSNKPQVRRRED